MTLNLPIGADTIGNQLSAINQTFEVLDEEISNLVEIMAQTLVPLLTFYKKNQADWAEALTASLSANWVSMTATVKAHSAHWLPPISVVYPFVVTPITLPTPSVFDAVHGKLPDWLNLNYAPIQDGIVKYVEGQIIHLNWVTFLGEPNPGNGLTRTNSSVLKQLTQSHHCTGSMQNKRTGADGGGTVWLDCTTTFGIKSGGAHLPNYPTNDLLSCEEGVRSCDFTNFCTFPQACYCMFSTPKGYIPSYNEIITTNLTLSKGSNRQDVMVNTPFILKGCRWIPHTL